MDTRIPSDSSLSTLSTSSGTTDQENASTASATSQQVASNSFGLSSVEPTQQAAKPAVSRFASLESAKQIRPNVMTYEQLLAQQKKPTSGSTAGKKPFSKK